MDWQKCSGIKRSYLVPDLTTYMPYLIFKISS